MEVRIEKVKFGYDIYQGDKYAKGLGWEEMIALVAQMTMPEGAPHLRWLKTKEEHEAHDKAVFDRAKNKQDELVARVKFNREKANLMLDIKNKKKKS